eukprot:Pgem_evm1s2219
MTLYIIIKKGNIQIVEGEDLRNWKQSYGLLGLILGVEFFLEERTHFRMFTTKQTLSKNYDKLEFLTFLQKMQNNNLAGEYFFDLNNNEMTVVIASNDPNYQGDKGPDQKTIIAGYQDELSANPQLPYTGSIQDALELKGLCLAGLANDIVNL